MPSIIDQLYAEIFGEVPKKEGEAYERLAALVCKHLAGSSPVFHDRRMRGLLSQSMYQLDVHEGEPGAIKFGEAKDYTEGKYKVGRGDLQKLAGALGDLPVAGGKFFSATGYTKPAKQYAEAAKDIVGKPIDLFHLRPSTERDLDGRVLEIRIDLHVMAPKYGPNCFHPEFTAAGQAALRPFAGPDGGIPLVLEKIVDSTGHELTSLGKLTAALALEPSQNPAVGFWSIPGGHLPHAGVLAEITGIKYTVPFEVTVHRISVGPNGHAKLLLKSEDGQFDKILTDTDLRGVMLDQPAAETTPDGSKTP